MNLEGAADWVKEHKAAAAAGIGVVLLAGLWMWHRSRTATQQQSAGDTAGSTGYTTPDSNGQYVIPNDGGGAVDGTTTGSVDPGASGGYGDILAALNDLNVTDAGLADQLGTVADTLKNLQPTHPTDPTSHKGGKNGGKGKGHGGKTHAAGGHGHGGTTKTPHPTHGGAGNGGHTGHTAKPKHVVLHNPNRPAGPTTRQRKGATGHQSKTTPHRAAKPAVVTHAPAQPRATKTPAKQPAKRKRAA